jgi:hypothetical protein
MIKHVVHIVTNALWSVNCIYITRRILVQSVLSLNSVENRFNQIQILTSHLRSILTLSTHFMSSTCTLPFQCCNASLHEILVLVPTVRATCPVYKTYYVWKLNEAAFIDLVHGYRTLQAMAICGKDGQWLDYANWTRSKAALHRKQCNSNKTPGRFCLHFTRPRPDSYM